MSESQAAAPAAAPAAAAAPAEAPAETLEATEAPEEGAEETKEEVAEKIEKKVESLKKKYNLKVNGKSKDIELDLSNDAEVQKYLQKAMASDEKFQEAALTKKNMEYLIEQLKTNPLSVLKHEALGIDVKALAQMVLEQEVEDSMKTPEQKRIEELEAALKSREEKEKEIEEERKKEIQARYEAEAMQALDEEVTEAISKSSLPKSPYVVKRLADAMMEAINMGYENVKPEQLMPYVEDQITEEIQRLFESSPDEVMEKLVSKKRLDGYRKARVQRSKAAPNETLKQAIKDTGSKKEESKKEELPPFKVKDLFKFS